MAKGSMTLSCPAHSSIGLHLLLLGGAEADGPHDLTHLRRLHSSREDGGNEEPLSEEKRNHGERCRQASIDRGAILGPAWCLAGPPAASPGLARPRQQQESR